MRKETIIEIVTHLSVLLKQCQCDYSNKYKYVGLKVFLVCLIS